jgi:PAS domain S-box-containing protein
VTATGVFDHHAGPALDHLLAGVVAHAPYAVAVVAPNAGTIIYTNAAWNRLFGYDEGEAAGQHLSSVNAPSDERFPGERIRQIAASLAERGVWNGRAEQVRRDGVRFWCSDTISQFEHESLGPVWVMLYAELSAV